MVEKVNNKKLEKPIFSYEGPTPSFYELYIDLKKHPLNSKIIVGYLVIFLIIFIIYYLITLLIKHKMNLSITIIILLSIISLFITIFFKIKGLKNTSKNSNANFYFYDDFILLKRKNENEYIFFNEINSIDESKKYFNIYKNGNRYIITKNKIKPELSDYLRKLKQNLKKLKNDSKYSYKNFIKNHKNEVIIYSKNNISEEILNKYYKINKIKKDFLINSLLVNLFNVHILLVILYRFIFKTYNFDIKVYSFLILEAFLLTIIFQKLYRKYFINKLLKNNNSYLYIFSDFIFINYKDKILRYNYNDIKLILDIDDLLLIKINYQLIALNKSILKADQIDYLYNKNTR